MGTVLISNKSIQWGQLAPILDGPARIRLSPEAKQSINKSHTLSLINPLEERSMLEHKFNNIVQLLES